MGVVYSSPSLAEQTDEQTEQTNKQTNKRTHTAAPIAKLAPACGLDGPARPLAGGVGFRFAFDCPFRRPLSFGCTPTRFRESTRWRWCLTSGNYGCR
jgi:hypothetical protein